MARCYIARLEHRVMHPDAAPLPPLRRRGDLDVAFLVAQFPKGCRGLVTQHGLVPGREQRRPPLAPVRQLPVADGIDTPVDDEEPLRLEALVDLVARVSRGLQLST